MNAYRAKPLNFPWPPLLYGAAILTALALGRLHPIGVVHSNGWAPWIAGSGFIVLAVSLDLWAVKTLIDRKTTVLPHRGSSHLVTCGPFRLTRNPIYLGYTFVMGGLGLIMLNPWFFIMAIVVTTITTSFAVRCEELHLHSRFGFEFERYCRKTSRWL